MTRSQLVTVRSRLDDHDRERSIEINRFEISSALLCPYRMIDYPTPSQTQSRATSVSGSSPPPTPSQGLGILNYSFPSSITDAFGASSSTYRSTTAAAGDWSVQVAMNRTSQEDSLGIDLFPTLSRSFSNAPLDALSFYTPHSASTPCMPMASGNIDFSLGPHQNPVLLQSNYQREGYHAVKQEEDSESWFNDHIDIERSQSRTDFSSHRTVKSASLSPCHVGNARLVSPSEICYDGLLPPSPNLRPRSQQFGPSSTAESESIDSKPTGRQSASNRTTPKTRRLSPSTEKRYVCSVCNRAFEKKYNLREHEKRHDPTRASQFVCPEAGCGKRLGRKTDVHRHVQSVHEKAKRFPCPRCAKRFDRKDTLAR